MQISPSERQKRRVASLSERSIILLPLALENGFAPNTSTLPAGLDPGDADVDTTGASLGLVISSLDLILLPSALENGFAPNTSTLPTGLDPAAEVDTTGAGLGPVVSSPELGPISSK